jgi:hypothetical protein
MADRAASPWLVGLDSANTRRWRRQQSPTVLTAAADVLDDLIDVESERPVRGQALEEAFVALRAEFTLEEFPKIHLHGLAPCGGACGDGVSYLFSDVLDL